ncbi:MAG TPA: Hsp20/alpha crystallin family protein [Planctomycetaceae bacterium]|jgi:HSP20 family protein|nr:Hsp20/alpha crystallin family protein [Planctomycetaceae bacterium]
MAEPENIPIQHQPAASHPHPAAATAPAPPPEAEEPRFLFTPPIDIFETDEGLVLHADLPGVSIKTLELQVQDNKLTLFGRVSPVVPPHARPLHQEYAVGDFLRSFILSDEVDHERITATMTNGVLKVVLPKAAQTKLRRIEVNPEPSGG